VILTREHIIQVLTSYFSKKPVNKVWLFGSYARGDADDNSDLDMLVDIDYKPGIGADYFKWNDELENLLHKKVDIVSVGWENKFIKSFIDRDKFIVYER
jgi:hypothetical protein